MLFVVDENEVVMAGETKQRPWYKKALLWICGIEGHVSTVSTVKPTHDQYLSLSEKRVWRIICDVSAVILMAIGVFMFVFWA